MQNKKEHMFIIHITLTQKLTWSDHCKLTASKPTKILNVLRRIMFGCSALAKGVAYRSIIRPCMEYACVVWNPHTIKDCALLKYSPKSCCKIYYEKPLGLRNFEVDKILQGLCVRFKLAIPIFSTCLFLLMLFMSKLLTYTHNNTTNLLYLAI